ncbi:MAG: protein kinase [Planctomycetota bacterium]|nr:protein kinase [Planctomycetota bacterium]
MMDDAVNQDEHHAEPADSMSEPTAETLMPPTPIRGMPERIGQFAPKQVLGTGGMGTVYLAVQEHPRRTVALKVMKKGIVSTSTLRRFEFESQVLARLRHPNIAQIFEAGTFDDGEGAVPYFAMEYIPNAKPIADHVRARGLGTNGILEIFVKVCDAIHHGHQKGVIHRDLKPDNILVDSSGEPKIIDFGVARSTQSDLAVTTLQTDIGQLVGTIQYMSPEQCDADPHDLDIRSDVYALGVVLYELLCGKLPYDVSKVAIFEAARVIKEAQATRPSTINRTLRGDLEAIMLKALEKDRDRRYQSATGLAKDLERYLHNEPIEARSPSMVYQIRMFARRNRAAFAAVLAITISMVIATVVSVTFGIQAVKQRDIAVEARVEAHQAKAESDRQRDAALAAEALADKQSYIVNVAAAAAALENGAIRTAKRRLSQAPQRLRSWEWQFLSNLADQSVGTLIGHEDRIMSVAFSTNGSWIVSGSTNGAIKVFNSATGEEPVRFRGHDSPVYAVACSPNGQHVASASADMSIRIWNMLTGDVLAILDGHEGVVTSLAYSADGRILVSGSSDASLRIWDPEAGEELTRIDVEDTSVDCVAISPDRTRIASGSDDGLLRFWDTATGELISALDIDGGFINSVQFTADGSRVASATEDGIVRLWSARDGSMIARLEGHAGFVSDVAFSPDGKYLVSGSEDNTVRIWDLSTGEQRIRLHGHESFVNSVTFSPDGRRIASGSEDRTIKLWDAHLFDRVDQPPGADWSSTASRVGAIAFSTDGARLVGGRNDGTVSFWDALTGRLLGTMAAHHESIRSIAVSSNGSLVATASDDNTIRIWDSATVRALGTLTGHTRRVTSVVFRSEDAQLLSGSWDGTIRVWNLQSMSEHDVWQINGGSINAVALSPDGTRLACASSNGDVVIVDMDSGERRFVLSGHDGPVNCLVYSSNGERLVSGSSDTTLRLWDATRGEAVAKLRGHSLGITALGFTPDGLRIISGSLDATIRIWTADTGEEVATLPWQNVGIDCIAVSPGGHRIASGSIDGSIIVRDSMPRIRRYQQRADSLIVAGSARRVIDRHLRDGLEDAEIVDRVLSDDSLSESLRRAALNRILQHSLREKGEP